ncbi:MAG: response regulator [Proteobacteria bacterium]|nr:response regulator [Pseudomonadota bacterium]MBU1686092.1 response regulator [Pseudomonadota bacterium]
MQGRILLVEDNPVNARILSSLLAEQGYTVQVSHSGEGCLERMGDGDFDLILLDIMMPGISGIEVLLWIRERWKPVELPVIMVSSIDDNERIVQALELGANDYLTKPVHIGIAVARISTQLAAAAFHRESVRFQKMQAIKAMVVTYNHEINNPLTIAMAEVAIAMERGSTEHLYRAHEAMIRITEIVKKIREVTSGEDVELANYPMGEKMIKF